MILDGCHFQYGDFESRKYGVIFARCGTKSYDQLETVIRLAYFMLKIDPRISIEFGSGI